MRRFSLKIVENDRHFYRCLPLFFSRLLKFCSIRNMIKLDRLRYNHKCATNYALDE